MSRSGQSDVTPRHLRAGAFPVSLAALCCAMAPARAETFTVGDAQVSFETTLSAGVGIRTSDQNPYFLDAAHGGTYTGTMGPSNLNWAQGKAFQAPLAATNDLQIDLSNYTAFFRANYFFDPILSDPNSAEYMPLSHSAQQTVGHTFRLLDGFVRGKYNIADQNEAVTVGLQTFNWGESLFIRNGLNAVNPISVAGIHAAGADIRDLYLPVPAIDLRTTLPNGFSLEAFYEFGWDKAQLDPYGTFYSTDVLVTPGATQIVLPPRLSVLNLGKYIPRADDHNANNQGEFGVALRKSFDVLGGGEAGLYFENYGARFPVANFTTGDKALGKGQTYASTMSYYAVYPDNIKYFGASLSLGGPWGTALQGEVSFSPNTPLQINPEPLVAAALGPGLYAKLSPLCDKFHIQLACTTLHNFLGTSYIAENGVPGYDTTIQGYQRYDVTHIRLSDIKSFAGIPNTPVQSWSLALEYGADIVNNFPNPAQTPLYRPLSLNALNPGDAAFFTKGVVNAYGSPTQVSEGIVARAGFSMPGLIAGVIDVNPSLATEWDFQGTTPAPLVTFDSHMLTTTVGVSFSYLQRWQAAVTYTFHEGLGATAIESVNLDRDYVALSASYRF